MTGDAQSPGAQLLEDPERLKDLLDEGLTYQDIVDRYDDITRSALIYRVRKYDIDPGYQTKYPSGPVPVHRQGDDLVEHPLPVDLVEQFEVEDGDRVGYTPVLVPTTSDGDAGAGRTVAMDVTMAPPAGTSNTAKLRKRETRHATLRYPRSLTAHIGLLGHFGSVTSDDDTDGTGVTAHPDPQDDRVRFRYEPALTAWTPSVEDPTARTGLDIYSRTVIPQGEGFRVSEGGPADVGAIESYRLTFPPAYVDRYGFDSVEETAILRFGEVLGQQALILDFSGAAAGYPASVCQDVHRFTSGNYEEVAEAVDLGFDEEAARDRYLTDRYGVGLSKRILHAHGLGIDPPNPTVHLVPGPYWIAILQDQPPAEGLAGDIC